MSIYQRVGFINIMALTTSGIMGMMFKMFKFQDFSAVQKRKKNGDLKMSYKKKKRNTSYSMVINGVIIP